MTPLERLESIDPHTHWADEAADFTPWVSSPEGLQLIGETLNLELETLSSSSEVPVGRFRADVVCVDSSESDNSLVLIENQLAPTDHNHVGQVLTYAAGLDAVTIIWIASKFLEEHTAVIEWLNRITNERYRFFGVEIGLVKIGESDPAPTFTVVAKPNDWSRGIRRQADSNLANSDLHHQFWTKLFSYVNENDIDISVGNPSRSNWMGVRVGTHGPWLNAVRLQRPISLRVELHFKDERFSSAYLAALDQQRADIEGELGFELNWDNARISVTVPNDPRDKGDWPAQIEWFSDMLQKFDRTFRHRIEAIDPADWST